MSGIVSRHYRYEQKLAALLWKIDVKDVIIPRTNSEHTLQQLRSAVNVCIVQIHLCKARTNSNLRIYIILNSFQMSIGLDLLHMPMQ